MNINTPTTMTSLRAHMIADMSARNLDPTSQAIHLRACKHFAAWLRRSPDTATPDEVKDFQQHLIESSVSICTRNQTMTGVKFLFRVTLLRHDLVAEIFHLRKPDQAQESQGWRVLDSHASSIVGGCGYFPQPWCCLACDQCRPYQPSSLSDLHNHC